MGEDMKATFFYPDLWARKEVCAGCLSVKTFAQAMAIQFEIRSSARNTSVWIQVYVCLFYSYVVYVEFHIYMWIVHAWVYILVCS